MALDIKALSILSVSMIAISVIFSGCSGIDGLLGKGEMKKAEEYYNSNITIFQSQYDKLNSTYGSRPGLASCQEFGPYLDKIKADTDELSMRGEATIDAARAYRAHLKNGSQEYLKAIDKEAELSAGIKNAEQRYKMEKSLLDLQSGVCRADNIRKELDEAYSRKPLSTNLDQFSIFVSSIKALTDEYSNANNETIRLCKEYSEYLQYGSSEYYRVMDIEARAYIDIKNALERYRIEYSILQQKLGKEQASKEFNEKVKALEEQDTKLKSLYAQVPDSASQEKFRLWLIDLKVLSEEYLKKGSELLKACDDYLQYLDPSASEPVLDEKRLTTDNMKVVKDNYNNNAELYNSYYQGSLPLIT
jgi:hypothetical protein